MADGIWPAPSTHMDKWLTVDEAAEAVRISGKTLHRYIQDGHGPRFSELPAGRRIKESWLTDWMLEREVAA